ncbi:hypothetical protein FZC79_18640 [Rossellomorea vietnamensis]|uniref:Uncharacterized protein n=1 Tax=Rossellomorea vietnamensis TaxID=218284 RepID=A0A5D4K9R9_9BACI|nr:hypothetical protein [Rossellomorea vietnamensis]TYR73460.1 hypothetical protein FZC79_18640 [Rossellomorea vietnamensis]
MSQVLDMNHDIKNKYIDIDELEENLYEEFQHIIEELSERITDNVMSSIISTPLDNIYLKYESQIPKLEVSTDQIVQISKQMQDTKKDLYENITTIISEVSNRAIEETVFKKLETIKEEYERQLPLLDDNSNELRELVKEIRTTKKELYQSTESIISEVSSKVIKEHIIVKFDELYRQHEIQLPKIKETSEQAAQLIDDLEETRKKLYSNISNVYNAMSNRIVDSVNEKLVDIYEKYNKKVIDLEQKHLDLQEVNADLNSTKNELVETITNYKSEILSIKKDIQALQNDSNILVNSLKEKIASHNKIIIGLGLVVLFSIFF